MSQVAALIDLIAQGKNAEASELLNKDLKTRSFEAIQNITPDVARNYFAPVVDMGLNGDGEIEYNEVEDESGEEYDYDPETETEEDSEE